MQQLNAYKNLIILFIILIISFSIYIYIVSLKDRILVLDNQKKELQIDLAKETIQSNLYKNAIEIQNINLENSKKEEEKALKKLEKWKNQPPKVKYKVITKFREIKSNECEDIKSIINAIRDINYSEL